METITSPFSHQQAFPGFLSDFMMCALSFQVHHEELLLDYFYNTLSSMYSIQQIPMGKGSFLRIFNEIAYKPLKMH